MSVKKSPTPEEVRATRLAAGLTQAQAAESIGAALKTWQCWESTTGEARNMPHAKLRLFKLVHRL